MKRFVLSVVLTMLAATVSMPLGAQSVKTIREKNKITIVEETPTEDGTIVTTTVMDKDSVFVSGFFQNWELSFAVGPHFYYGDNDWKVRKKREMVAFPAIDVYLTKWVSPTFGLGLGVTTGRFKGLYQDNPAMWNDKIVAANFQYKPTTLYYDKNSEPYGYQWIALQRGWFTNVYFDAHVDMISLFKGYNPSRVYGLDVYAGGGLIMGNNHGEFIPSATFNFGLLNQFKLSDVVSLKLGLRGALVADDFDGELYLSEPDKEHRNANHKMDGNFGVTAGVTIDLGGRKWRTGQRSTRLVRESFRDTVTIYEPAVVAPVPIVDAGKQTDTLLIKQVPEVWFHVNFDLDKWEIKSREMVNLQAIADLIKSTPGVRYLVCGYADKQTATPAHNQMLSENRSRVVYETLINTFGIDPAQLVRDAKGGVDYMFYNEKELSRCVMITAIQE